MQPFLIISFILLGITSGVIQPLFIREIEQIFYGNELCLGVIFSGWLFFIGIGSIIGRKIKKHIYWQIQLALSFILLIEFIFIHSIKYILKIGPGELIQLLPMLIFSFFSLAPICLCIGILFVQYCSLCAEAKKDSIKGVIDVYIFDAIGDVIGGFLFAYILIYIFSFSALLIVGLINLIIATILSKRKWLFSLALLYIIGLWNTKTIEKKNIKLDYPAYEVINHKRTIYGNLVFIKLGSLYSVYENGALSFSYPLPQTAEELVHIPCLQVKNIKRMLILGGSPELLNESIKYNLDKIYWVRLENGIIDLCKNYIDLSVLKNEKVQIVFMDERRFVKNYKGEKFDVIIINVGEPSTALINRFYTYEFFNEIKNILKEGGVVSLRIASNPNYLSDELKEYNATIYWTLKKVFPQVVIAPGEEIKFFASYNSTTLTDSAEVLANRFNVPTKHITKYYLAYEFFPERINYIKRMLNSALVQTIFNIKKEGDSSLSLRGVKRQRNLINSDYKPISYFYNIVVLGAYFSQTFKKFFTYISKKPFYLILGIMLVLLFIINLFTKATISTIGVLGFTGISTQILILLAFQSLYGYMYHKIGIITGTFMLGMVFGARYRFNKMIFIVLLIILYLGILYFVIKLQAQEFIFYLLPIICGFIIGTAWSTSNNVLISSGYKVEYCSGVLYGADLLGSCIGSFLFSILFIPIYGIYKSIFILIALNILSILFLIKKRI